jgi:hypothetical protein
MAKQIMISERPGESAIKQSIGNYKGVMLCNRPNDPTEKLQRDGPAPFISRVTVKEQLGINPANKPVVTKEKPKQSPEILRRHKLWLSQLQKQKEEEIKKQQENSKAQEEKIKKMKKKYKPKKIPEPKNNDIEPKSPEPDTKSDKLTEKNLKILEKEKKGKEKPKWAMTKAEADNQEEAEVDDLLKFVQDLDYDSFIDDLEVRQALEIVRERVDEIKKDKEWKKNIAVKFNEDDDKQSVGSKGSMKSYVSKARSQVESVKKPEGEWDASVSFYLESA